jgi:FkbM family methyltransferase
MTFVSYAQNMEDVLLWRALKHIENGHYIDIGAWDPIKDSVSKGFYEQGWRGINVEPIPYFAELLAKDRPTEMIIQKAVGNSAGKKVIYNVSETGLSTFSEKFAEYHSEMGRSVNTVEVDIFRLKDIGNPFECGTVHWMKIDVEGSELEVLSGWDPTKLRPWIIVIESVDPIRLQIIRSEWEHLLTNARYKLAYFDGLNDFYVDLEHPELLGNFEVPINFLDDYIKVSELQSHNKLINLEQELAESGKERENLEQELAESGKERENLEQELAESGKERENLELKLSRKSLENINLSGQFESLLKERNEFANRLAVLSALILPEKDTLNLKRILNRPYSFLLRHRLLLRMTLIIVHRTNLKKFGTIFLRSKLFKILILIYRFRLFPEFTPIKNMRAFGKNRNLQRSIRDITSITPKTFRRKGKFSTHARRKLLKTYMNSHKIDTRLKAWDERLMSLVVGSASNWEKFQLDLELDLSTVTTRLQEVKQERLQESPLSFEQIIVDARCMSDPAFRTRGIGTYGTSFIESLQMLPQRIDLIILGDSADFTSDVQSRFKFRDPEVFSSIDCFKKSTWFIQLSPMTSNPLPIAGILLSPKVRSSSLVFDLIPLSYPSFYLPTKKNKEIYVNQLKVLEFYDEHLFISESTMKDFQELTKSSSEDYIIWPEHLLPHNWKDNPVEMYPNKLTKKRMIILSGDDARKNIPMALKMAEYALNNELIDDVAIVGYANNLNYISALISHLNCEKSKIAVCNYLSHEEYKLLLAGSIVSVVCSFAEGLSLPVIESIMSEVPVVISDIPAHLELVGGGYWAANPNDLFGLCSALESTLQAPLETYRTQRSYLKNRKYIGIQEYVLRKTKSTTQDPSKVSPRKKSYKTNSKLDIVISTPLPPARSGIADHSRFWIPYLAKIANVTVLTNSGAVPFDGVSISRYESSEWLSPKYDARVNVLGNSHYHLQGIHLTPAPNTLSICHDVRMIELVSSSGIKTPPPTNLHLGITDLKDQLRHKLDHTLDLNLGFAGQISQNLLFHSKKISRRIAGEYGFTTHYLPLIPYRFPELGQTWKSNHKDQGKLSKDRQINIGFFGDADIETKSVDTIIEAINWLADWGLPVKFRIIGNMHPQIENKLRLFFSKSELARITATGYLSEQKYISELGSIDIAIELRSAHILGLSGSLADLVAFGVPTVVSQGLMEQMELPSYCFSVGNDYTPLIVAMELQRVINLIREENSFHSLEKERETWVQERTPEKYVSHLLDIIREIKN